MHDENSGPAPQAVISPERAALERNVLPEVRRIVSNVTDVPEEELGVDLDLVDRGIIDSMEALHVVNDLERSFGILIPDGDISRFRTLRSISEEVVRLQNESEAG